jgi:hypothetical protein
VWRQAGPAAAHSYSSSYELLVLPPLLLPSLPLFTIIASIIINIIAFIINTIIAFMIITIIAFSCPGASPCARAQNQKKFVMFKKKMPFGPWASSCEQALRR